MFSFRRVFLFFLAGGKQVLPNLSISLSPRCTPCSVFVRLSSVLPVSEVLFVVWLWLRLRWEARPGQVRRMRRCKKAHGVTNAFETCVLCFRRRCKATEAHSAGGIEADQSLRSAFIPHCTNPLLLSTVWGYSSNTTTYRQVEYYPEYNSMLLKSLQTT